jgi:hypothetical protein
MGSSQLTARPKYRTAVILVTVVFALFVVAHDAPTGLSGHAGSQQAVADEAEPAPHTDVLCALLVLGVSLLVGVLAIRPSGRTRWPRVPRGWIVVSSHPTSPATTSEFLRPMLA